MEKTKEYAISLMGQANKIWLKEDGRDDKAELFYNVALALDPSIEETVKTSLHACSLKRREVTLDDIIDCIQEALHLSKKESSKKEIYENINLKKLNPAQIKVNLRDDIYKGIELGIYNEDEIHINDDCGLNY